MNLKSRRILWDEEERGTKEIMAKEFPELMKEPNL